MTQCAIASATPEDIEHLIRNLRPEHVREIHDVSGLDPETAIRLSVQDSSLVLAGRIEGETVCVIGVSKKRLLSDAGSVWMLATPGIDQHPLEAAVALRELFSHAHELAGAGVLEQWVPHWYRKGIKFLQWLGWRDVDQVVIKTVKHHHMIHVLTEEKE